MKSINNQKHQKIKLHGTPTTKEVKKKINQNNQTSKAADWPADSEKPVRHADIVGRAGCPAWQL